MIFKQNVHKKILKQIKKYETIVIARHVGPDPDALGSSLGLKQIIKDNFKEKNVYVIGNPAAKFNYLGTLDKLPENINNKKALLIVTDTPDRRRVDGVDPLNFPNSVKIDHHPFMEKTCKIEWIDEDASSASQMILELSLEENLYISKEAAEKLYIGIIADTNRFLFKYTTSKTFYLVSELLKRVNINITELYDKLYVRDYREIKFKGYIAENFTITENNVGYIIIKDEILKKYGVDAATPGNIVSDFNHIKEMLTWMTATEDKELGSYRISVRSRGPIINDVVSKFGGGGHIYASGARLKSETEILNLVQALDEEVSKYKKQKS